MDTPVNNASNAAATPYPEVYRSLMTVGLLGSVYGRHEDAETVSAAVEKTLGDPLQYRINRAIAQGIGGDSASAVAALGEHLDAHPDDEGARVAMAVSMMLRISSLFF